MTKPPYHTANVVPGAIADADTLAPDAVRCLWVRPIEGRFLPTVIFRDGTDCPLACQMDEMQARQFCQRISAVHDWPVMDHRPKGIGPGIAAEQSWKRVPPEFKIKVNGETCVNMDGIGFMMADMCREFGLPYGVAIHRVTERIGSFIANMVEQGAMTDQAGRENAKCMAGSAFDRLNKIYAVEGRDDGLLGEEPQRLGIALADYHASLGSDDARFQSGLGVALTTALEVWTGEGEPEDVAKERADVTMDAAIRHWFRLTGRPVAGGPQ